MSSKYVYRLDDITPDMNWEQFRRYMELFEANNVVPLLGVVPDNNDPNLTVGKTNESFWDIIRELQRKGKVEVAQHGYRHELAEIKMKESGLRKFGVSPLSEFTGLTHDKQYEMIKSGMRIMRANGIYSDIWMSPCHTFDETTLDVLTELGFKSVTDGIALYPFKYHGLVFVPQQLWKPRMLPLGVYTVCLHINNADGYIYDCIRNHIESGARVVRFSEAAAVEKGILGLAANAVFRILYSILRCLRPNKAGKRCHNEG